MKRIGLVGVVLAIALSGGAGRLFGGVYSDTLDVTLPFEAGKSFSIETLSGSVAIEGTAGSDVRILAIKHARGEEGEARKTLDELKIEVKPGRERIEVVAHFPSRRGGFLSYFFDEGRDAGHEWVDFDIRLPAAVRVAVDGTSADVDVRNLGGDLSLDLTSGNVTGMGMGGDVGVDGTSGDVDLRTVKGNVSIDNTSGDVRVEACGGNLEIDKTSGEVTMRRIGGDVDMDGTSSDVTGEEIDGYVNIDLISGDVDLKEVGAGVSFDDVSGDIAVAFHAAPVRKCDLSTISGEVDLRLGAAGDLDLDLESMSGELQVELEGLQVREMSKSSLRASTGAGTVPVHVETVSGDVKIHQR